MTNLKNYFEIFSINFCVVNDKKQERLHISFVKSSNGFNIYTLSFYKNMLYKNVEAETCEILRIFLRINQRLRF